MIILSSCGGRIDSTITDIYLTSDKTITELSDSTFFKIMRSLVFYDNKLYCAEENRSQILVLDENLALMNTIGHIGRGPLELSYVGCLSVYKDTVVVTDPGNNRMQIYLNNGVHVKSDYAIYEDYLLPSNRFVYKNGIYVGEAKTNVDNSLIAYNSITYSSQYFGEKYRFKSSLQDNIRNHRYVLDGQDDYVLSISNNMPYIEKYDYISGELLCSFDISDIEPIRSRQKENETGNLPENSYMSYLSDCNIFSNRVYLLCCDNVDSYRANKVVVFNCENDIKLIAKYILPDMIYSSIAVSDKYLFAFSVDKCELQRFEL
jgi:hypothetical protein